MPNSLSPIHVLGRSPLLGLLAYGMGLFLSVDSPHGKVVGHVGEGPGYSAAAFHFSNLSGNRVTLTAFANRDRQDLGLQLVFQMVRVLEGFC
jgi:D-alanyl-D-alanine carboxypeptidase